MQGMVSYTQAAMERAMKVQEVILRAMAKKITWWQAAEIIGISDRQMRRWRERYEEFGFRGLFDRRRGRPSPKRVPVVGFELEDNFIFIPMMDRGDEYRVLAKERRRLAAEAERLIDRLDLMPSSPWLHLQMREVAASIDRLDRQLERWLGGGGGDARLDGCNRIRRTWVVLLRMNIQCVAGDSSRSPRISSRIRCMIFFASS